MSTDCAAIAERLRREAEAVDRGTADPADFESDDDDRDIIDAYVNSALEVYVDVRHSLGNGSPIIRKVGLLLGFGGPTIRLEVDENGDGNVSVNWWGDGAKLAVSLPNIADRLYGLAEDYEIGR